MGNTSGQVFKVVRIALFIAFGLFPLKIHATAGIAEFETEFIYNNSFLLRQYYVDGVCKGSKGCFELMPRKRGDKTHEFGTLENINAPLKSTGGWIIAKAETGQWIVFNPDGVKTPSFFFDFESALISYSAESGDNKPTILTRADLREHLKSTMRGLILRNIVYFLIFLGFLRRFLTFFLF